MITKQQALAIAALHLREIRLADDQCVVVDEDTIEKPYGWVFCFTSKKFLDTGSFEHALAGNGPMVVGREDGFVTRYGAATSIEESLAEHQRKLGVPAFPMSRRELIAAAENDRVPEPLGAVVSEVAHYMREHRDVLMSGGSAGGLPASHYREVYEHRLKHAERTGLMKLGLRETVAALGSLADDALLDMVTVRGDERSVTLWIDPRGAVVGCIVHAEEDAT